MNVEAIQQALTLWFLTLESEGRSPYTITTYRNHMKIVVAWLGTRELDVFTWRLFMAESQKKYSPFSCRAFCATARSFVKFCTEEEILEDDSLLKRMRLPHVPDTPRRALSPGQLQALMAHLADDRRAYGIRNHAAVTVLLDTGMRLSELVNLELEDLADDCLYIRRSKNGSQRVVPLGKQAYSALLRYLRVARPRLCPTSDSLWAGWSRNGIQNMMRKLAIKLGFPVSTHMMRHTFATEAIKSGADLETVRRIAGWRDYRMLMTYCHLQVADLRERHRQWSLGDRLARPARSAGSTRTA